MGNSVKRLKKVIEECSDTNRHEWPDEARIVLEAVRRVSRPTKGKVRRTIAEAILKKLIVPSIANSAWRLHAGPHANPSGSMLLERNGVIARIEIALLQPTTAKSRRAYRGQHSESEYAFEVKKAEAQKKTAKKVATRDVSGPKQTTFMKGRSFAFGEFDILAINIQAATYRWSDFRYTLSDRLRPHPNQESFINEVQSVPLKPNDVWTADINACLEWFAQRSKAKPGSPKGNKSHSALT